MKISRPLISIAIRFLQADGDNKVFIPDAIRTLQDRYRFWRVPQTMEEYSQSTGAEFSSGIFEGVPVNSFRIYANGIRAEAEADTIFLDRFLDDVIEVAKGLGLKYRPSAPVARIYTSSLEVAADIGFTERYAELSQLWQRLTTMVAGYGITLSTYQLATMAAHSDPTVATPIQPGRFIFERRAGHPFGENLFYSEAPVSTNEHLELLEILEAIWTTASQPPSVQSPPDAPAS